MKGLWKVWFPDVPDFVRIELVDMCFQTRVPLTIVGFIFVVVSAHMAADDRSVCLTVLSAAGLLATAVRVFSDFAYHRYRRHNSFGIADAAGWERLYGWSGLAFAALIGGLGFAAFQDGDPSHQLLTTALVFGYAAGIVCRISVRPAIALPTLALIAIPTALSAASRIHSGYVFYSFILVAFLLGSFETVRFLYRQHVEQITLKHKFAKLARNDALTGLANRLGFEEQLAIVSDGQRQKGNLLAVHSLDLDRFKEINDRHGHPVGDAVLKAVAHRLNGLLREGDFAARMGGDEFLVIQMNVNNRDDAMLLARRIVATLSAPIAFGNQEVAIGASVGVAIGSADQDPSVLVPAADRALYESKVSGRSRATFAKPTLVEASSGLRSRQASALAISQDVKRLRTGSRRPRP